MDKGNRGTHALWRFSMKQARALYNDLSISFTGSVWQREYVDIFSNIFFEKKTFETSSQMLQIASSDVWHWVYKGKRWNTFMIVFRSMNSSTHRFFLMKLHERELNIRLEGKTPPLGVFVHHILQWRETLKQIPLNFHLTDFRGTFKKVRYRESPSYRKWRYLYYLEVFKRDFESSS